MMGLEMKVSSSLDPNIQNKLIPDKPKTPRIYEQQKIDKKKTFPLKL
jgi:hypothetical protein